MRLPLWPIDYLEMCCLFSKDLEIFLLPFHCEFLVYFHVLKNILCVISFLLYLLKFCLVLFCLVSQDMVHTDEYSIMDKKMYSAIVEWNVLYVISTTVYWLVVLFRSSVSMLIFWERCLIVKSNCASVTPFSSISFCFL